ncbi:MAG: methionyl-tRNA formyltransferase [Bacteroidetes bacterium]|nr:methionyl-tRNA formyltransferase [Bacteroidota bacterium]
MKLIFMGTPEFAVASLDILVKNNFNVVAVVTAPDKPAGRGQQLQQSAVKQYALTNNLNVLQPTNLKDGHFMKELKALQADLQIVVAFRMLPEAVWNMPKLGTYNLHASLLPKFRGAAPINWAIITGEEETGVTTFKLKHEIDTGNILFQEHIKISNTETAGELHDALMKTGAGLVLKTVKEIEKSVMQNTPLNFISQNDNDVSHAPKIFKDTCKINWNNDVKEIYNLIRGLSPYPTAFTQFRDENGKELIIKIFFAKYNLQEHNYPIGTISSDNKTFLNVYGKNGMIELTDLQLQGKRRMPVSEFLKGFRIHANSLFV